MELFQFTGEDGSEDGSVWDTNNPLQKHLVSILRTDPFKLSSIPTG